MLSASGVPASPARPLRALTGRAGRAGALAAIRFYQRVLSPHKGFRCAHDRLHAEGSCSAYGARVIGRHGVRAGVGLLRVRFASCRLAAEHLVAEHLVAESVGSAGGGSSALDGLLSRSGAYWRPESDSIRRRARRWRRAARKLITGSPSRRRPSRVDWCDVLGCG